MRRCAGRLISPAQCTMTKRAWALRTVLALTAAALCPAFSPPLRASRTKVLGGPPAAIAARLLTQRLRRPLLALPGAGSAWAPGRGARVALRGQDGDAVNNLVRARLGALRDGGADAQAMMGAGLEAIRQARAAALAPTTENFNYIIYLVSRARGGASPAVLDNTLAALKAEGMSPDTKSFNLLLSAAKPRGAQRFAEDADPMARTLSVLASMHAERVPRDDFTYTLVFSACARLAKARVGGGRTGVGGVGVGGTGTAMGGARALRLARELVAELEMSRVEPSTYTINAAIDVFAKAAGGGAAVSACLDAALEVFAHLEGVNTVDACPGGVNRGAGRLVGGAPSDGTEVRATDDGVLGLREDKQEKKTKHRATSVTYTSLLDLACAVVRFRGSAAADRQVAFELGVLALSELVATFREEPDVDLPRLGSMLIIALANSALGTGGAGQSSEAVCRASWVLVWLRQQGVAVRSGASAKLMSATSVALTKQSSGTLSPPCPPSAVIPAFFDDVQATETAGQVAVGGGARLLLWASLPPTRVRQVRSLFGGGQAMLAEYQDRLESRETMDTRNRRDEDAVVFSNVRNRLRRSLEGEREALLDSVVGRLLMCTCLCVNCTYRRPCTLALP